MSNRLDRARAYLSPPIFEDEEKTRQARLLHIILLSLMAFAIMYGIIAPLLYENPLPLEVTVALVLPLWLTAFVLLRRGRIRLAGFLFLSVLWLVVTGLAVIYGGVSASAVSTYITLVLAAGLILGTRAGLGFAALSLAASAGMLHAELTDVLPQSLVAETPGMIWIGLTTNLTLAAVLLIMATNSTLNALDRAQQNERELAEANRELEAEITERTRAEQALKDSEERYRTILEGIEDGYYEVDLAGNFTFFNKALSRIIRYPSSEMMGMNNRQYMDKANAKVVFQTFNQVHRTGEPTRGFDWELLGKDGTRRCVEASVSLMRDSKGQPVGFRGIVRDITERKQADEALRESERWLRTIVEGTHALLVGVDRRGRFTYVNDALARFVGRSPEDLIGKLYLRFVHPEDRGWVNHRYLEQVRDGARSISMESRALDAKGEVRWVGFVANPMFEAGELVESLGVAMDITDRVRAEEALRESEERWRMYIEQANDLIFTLNTAGKFTSVNRAVCSVSGYSAKELLGMSALELVPLDSQPAAAELLARMMGGEEIDQAELQIVTRGGRRLFLEVRGRFLFEHGEFVGTFHIARDITGRKEAEASLREWTQELEARNAELDAFAHTVAHDLQDPVALIIGYADVLAEEDVPLSEEARQGGLVIIQQSSRKVSNIIDELLLLAEIRKRSVDSTRLEMGHIVPGALARLALLVEEQQAQFSLPETWPAARGYEPWIEEVWVNYLSNAVKYGGRPPQVELGADVLKDGRIRFWVRDNGPGLSAEEQARLFMPFTKLSQAQTKGHGLGLSIARRIVHKLGGEVGVESEGAPGRGSLFSFTLPGAD